MIVDISISELFKQIPLFSILLIGVVLLLCIVYYRYRGQMMASSKPWLRVLGLSLNWLFFAGLALIVALCFFINWADVFHLGSKDAGHKASLQLNTFLLLAFLLLINIMFIGTFRMVKKALLFDDFRYKDSMNFWYQNVFVFFVGVSIIELIVVLDINDKNFLPYAMFAVLGGWIFQDIIKGILAYYHMRALGQIHIGDWVQIPSKGIDGVIVDFSLVNVKINNWDNTISSVPTTYLQSEHLVNYQNMLNGETSGRRMLKTFFIDITSIRILKPDEKATIINRLEAEGISPEVFADTEEPTLNLQMFRLYLRHWLQNNRNITRSPRLLLTSSLF